MKMKNVALASLALIALGGATPALALTSYEGDDYSRDFNSVHQVRACDMESDAHGVHADYQGVGGGTTQQIRDGDGANNGCAETGYFTKKVTAHRIVEEINVVPDQFGPWVYPS